MCCVTWSSRVLSKHLSTSMISVTVFLFSFRFRLAPHEPPPAKRAPESPRDQQAVSAGARASMLQALCVRILSVRLSGGSFRSHEADCDKQEKTRDEDLLWRSGWHGKDFLLPIRVVSTSMLRSRGIVLRR